MTDKDILLGELKHGFKTVNDRLSVVEKKVTALVRIHNHKAVEAKIEKKYMAKVAAAITVVFNCAAYAVNKLWQ